MRKVTYLGVFLLFLTEQESGEYLWAKSKTKLHFDIIKKIDFFVTYLGGGEIKLDMRKMWKGAPSWNKCCFDDGTHRKTAGFAFILFGSF